MKFIVCLIGVIFICIFLGYLNPQTVDINLYYFKLNEIPIAGIFFLFLLIGLVLGFTTVYGSILIYKKKIKKLEDKLDFKKINLEKELNYDYLKYSKDINDE